MKIFKNLREIEKNYKEKICNLKLNLRTNIFYTFFTKKTITLIKINKNKYSTSHSETKAMYFWLQPCWFFYNYDFWI